MARVEAARTQDDRDDACRIPPSQASSGPRLVHRSRDGPIASLGGGGAGLASSSEAEAGLASLGNGSGAGLATSK
eukprot:2561429-Pleurochrysis_carterae.AAC.1